MLNIGHKISLQREFAPEHVNRINLRLHFKTNVIVPENKKEELERFLEELGIIGKVTIWTLP